MMLIAPCMSLCWHQWGDLHAVVAGHYRRHAADVPLVHVIAAAKYCIMRLIPEVISDAAPLKHDLVPPEDLS